MTYNEIISQVALSTGLSEVLVNRAYKSYWRAINEYIASLPLMEDLSDKEFVQLRPNINIPSIGKLYVTLKKYQSVKRHYNDYIKNRHQKDNNYAIKD